MDEEHETADPKQKRSSDRPTTHGDDQEQEPKYPQTPSRHVARQQPREGEGRQLDGSQLMGGVQGGGRFDFESSA